MYPENEVEIFSPSQMVIVKTWNPEIDLSGRILKYEEIINSEEKGIYFNKETIQYSVFYKNQRIKKLINDQSFSYFVNISYDKKLTNFLFESFSSFLVEGFKIIREL